MVSKSCAKIHFLYFNLGFFFYLDYVQKSIQYLLISRLKICFSFKNQSLFFLHFSHSSFFYLSLDPFFSFCLSPWLWGFMGISKVLSSYLENKFRKKLGCFLFLCFVFVLKFASEMLLNKNQRQNLRLLLSLQSQDVKS